MSTSSPYIFIAIGFVPFIVISILCFLKFSMKCFYALFALQFIIVIFYDFTDLPLGITTYITSFVMTLLILVYNYLYENSIKWNVCKTPMLWALLIWIVFCLIEIANPNTVLKAWAVNLAPYAIYPLICFLLVPLTLRKQKDINILLIIWSIFVIIAIAIAFRQQHFGWNTKEKIFLYVLDGAKTHIIWSGIRYFSCFTDAANFGVHMAMAATTFGISAFYVKNKFFKIYLVIIMALAFYGMAISGTRSAIAIPFGALIALIALSKNIKISISTALVMIFMFCFFSFTHIGDGNAYIHKMRSAFHPTSDPSYIVRVENRLKMKALVLRKPLGYGLGLSKPGLYHPKERMPYPPDSFLVSVWVETGYVGLALYLAVHIFLFAWASWLLLFKVSSKRVRGLAAAWLGMAAGFFISAYANDVMQYPNPIVIYTAFAICIAAPYIDQYERSKTTDTLIKKTNSNG
jgi:hypothetical protein